MKVKTTKLADRIHPCPDCKGKTKQEMVGFRWQQRTRDEKKLGQQISVWECGKCGLYLNGPVIREVKYYQSLPRKIRFFAGKNVPWNTIKPKLGTCSVCEQHIHSANPFTETRPTGINFELQVFAYCEKCTPEKSKQVHFAGLARLLAAA